MTIRDAAIKDAAQRENNRLLQTNSEIFSEYMNPYCQKYIAPKTLKVEFECFFREVLLRAEDFRPKAA